LGVITLLTDFGLKDGNVGVLKGVIWQIAPQVQIADLSHMVAPQNIFEAALVLLRSAPYFPERTIHVGVVDPGVGTERRPIAACLGSQYFVGPDNGMLTMLLERTERQGLPVTIVNLNRPEFWLPEVSYVFHGRDIFAPSAAHLAKGVSITDLGDPLIDPVRLTLHKPQRTELGWTGEVVHIDHFGNVSSNILTEHLGNPEKVRVLLCGETINGLVHTFGDRQPGEVVALYGSTGNLIVSLVNGSAAEWLGAKLGDPFDVIVGE